MNRLIPLTTVLLFSGLAVAVAQSPADRVPIT